MFVTGRIQTIGVLIARNRTQRTTTQELLICFDGNARIKNIIFALKMALRVLLDIAVNAPFHLVHRFGDTLTF